MVAAESEFHIKIM